MGAFAALSSVVGVTLLLAGGYIVWDGWIWFLGLAHAIALVPAMVMSRTPVWKMAVATLVCLFFPVWGFMGVMFVASLASPVVCSFLWGLVVAWAIRRRIAILFFAIVGVLSNAGMFVSIELFDSGPDGWWLLHCIGVWHVLMIPTYCWLMSFSPSPLPFKPIDYTKCQACDYSLAGLPADAVCPECGALPLDERV